MNALSPAVTRLRHFLPGAVRHDKGGTNILDRPRRRGAGMTHHNRAVFAVRTTDIRPVPNVYSPTEH
jgi:hypothetical protein